MSYIQTYFRIKGKYAGYNGWATEEDSKAFKEETTKLFNSHGWEIKEGRSSGACDTAVRGKESLYLHPMHFSGVILQSSIPGIEEMLCEAKEFEFYHTDTYGIYYEMSDSEYLLKLCERRAEMIEDLLSLYQTKRRNLYITSDVLERLEKKYKINRVGENTRDTILKGVLQNIFDMLLAKGELIASATKNGIGYRAATDKDRKEKLSA